MRSYAQAKLRRVDAHPRGTRAAHAPRTREAVRSARNDAARSSANDAQAALERHLSKLRHDLKLQIQRYPRWIESREGLFATPEEAQRRFSLLRLEFNRVLSHVDIFSEALSQRSEADTGLWLCGLDVVARDALVQIEPPPVICYLARGAGADPSSTHAPPGR